MRLFKIEQRVYLFFWVNHYETINKILLVKKKAGAIEILWEILYKGNNDGLTFERNDQSTDAKWREDNSIPPCGWTTTR